MNGTVSSGRFDSGGGALGGLEVVLRAGGGYWATPWNVTPCDSHGHVVLACCVITVLVDDFCVCLCFGYFVESVGVLQGSGAGVHNNRNESGSQVGSLVGPYSIIWSPA